MARMTNYFWVDAKTHKVIFPTDNISCALAGKCYGHKGFTDGTSVISSRIKTVVGSIVITTSGTRYVLEEMHPDYKELLNAREAGIPIIDSWRLEGDYRKGYTLHGTIGDVSLYGKVERQKGNFVTIDGMDYLVIWYNVQVNDLIENMVYATGKYCDMYVSKDFVPYMNDPHARPKLFE